MAAFKFLKSVLFALAMTYFAINLYTNKAKCVCLLQRLLLLSFSSKPHDVKYFCDPLGQGKIIINFVFENLTKKFFLENLSLSGLGLYGVPYP